ncbi:MAG: carboxypeptidase-like regulatory domain-containing protein [bacterium]|nr:carboxypeptidase-like regulatory domain-containing protein [bacterium]
MNKFIKFFMVLGIFAIIFSAGCFKADRNNIFDPDGDNFDPSILNYTIKGNVYRGHLDIPIQGALVSILNEDKNVYTDSDGYFEFKDIPPGEYNIRISKEGWRAEYDTVKISALKQANEIRRDYNLFIFREDFDQYTVGSFPDTPRWAEDHIINASTVWFNEVRNINSDQILFMELTETTEIDKRIQSDLFTNPAWDNIQNVLIGINFYSFDTYGRGIFQLWDLYDNIRFQITADANHELNYNDSSGTHLITNTFQFGNLLFFLITINPTDKSIGTLDIFNSNWNSVLPNPINLNFGTNLDDIGKTTFIITNYSAVTMYYGQMHIILIDYF